MPLSHWLRTLIRRSTAFCQGEEAVMIVSLLMGLVADLVFDSAASMRRSFGAEIDRYYQDRGLRSTPPKPRPTR
jgi:hypothetical protein